ncbi:hypothetical protein DQ237_12325 [Blastococcus sp. TF02-8]|nr:hypothetical protein DQ237_12325 [Blastococcus sp. TF02-8]
MTAGATVVLLGGGAAMAPIVFAEEAPQRALQAVTVELASDGAVTGLTSALVSRGEDGEDPTTRTTALNPAEHAGDLPVRVTTSWRHDGRVGTDLADVEGVDGRVEINVTVQNLTGRPERFRYDANGVARESYEIVTTPMTVVASAVLPGDGAATLVRPQAAATEPGTTNGVITTEDDATTVQWASILAPPRLQPSTTFTLVQDAQDFELPAINLAVQPGVATDDSVARLVSDIFGGSAQTVGSENHTIGLIANVNATLAQVTDSLQTVRETLAVNAGQVGAAATTALRATAASVDSSAQAVLRDLRALESSMGSTVSATNSSALGALDESVQGVLDFFGSPAPTSGPTPPTACGDQAAAQPPASTLLGQLDTVSRQLRQLADASGDCVADLKASLQDTIGISADCPAGSESLVCRLVDAGDQLETVADEVKTRGQDISSTLDLDLVTDLRTWLTTLEGDVSGLKGQAASLQQTMRTTPQALPGIVGELRGQLTAALNRLNAPLTNGLSVDQALDEVRGVIDARLNGPDSEALERLRALVLSTCPADPATAATPAQDAVRVAIDGRTCAGTAVEGAYESSVQAGLDADRLAVLGGLGKADAGVADVIEDLDAVGRLIDGLPTKVDGAFDGQLDAQVTQLVALLSQLDEPSATEEAPLEALKESIEALEVNRGSVKTGLQAILDEAEGAVRTDARGRVEDARSKAEGARDEADSGLGDLSRGMSESLNGSAEQQLAQGKAVVVAQTARLAAVEAAAEQELDAAAQAAIGQLAAQITLANQSQAAAAQALQEQLQKVLLDLGSAAEGRGLLGVIQNSAGQTGVRTEQVAQTSESAASFRGVRQAEVADAQLEQQQFARSLQAAQRFQPFAEELPKGSVSATVFCFRIGGEN